MFDYFYTDKDNNSQTISVSTGTIEGNKYIKYHDDKRNISLFNANGLSGDDLGSPSAIFKVIRGDEYISSEDSNNDMFNQTMKTYSEIYDFYLNNYNWKSFDNKGTTIKIVPNISNFENACWHSFYNTMFIGTLAGRSLVYGEDVLVHELTHGVVSGTAGFGSDCGIVGTLPNEPGALNGSYADILGHVFDDDDWVIGDGVGITIRDAVNPHKTYDPMSLSDKYYFPQLNGKTPQEYLKSKRVNTLCHSTLDNGGVHANSNVFTHAAYLMYNEGIFSNRVEMGRVYFSSLHRLNSNSRFEDAALAVYATAKDLGYDENKLNVIYNAFKTVGIFN